ncbi:glutamate--tRNA ligase, mitochondrial [Trichomonascus vanleenenianus]|uniref:glutamate--tRNA ligase MSE1 n=1 Tax=Trichomonascus vanleenenianus TaxID=2268995 RepID=UPI003ECAFF8A
MLVYRSIRRFSTTPIRSAFSLRSSKLRDSAKKKNASGAEIGQPKSLHPTSPARTRFAPSPTGFLHLGSLRTALYNYLLAKNTGGQFLLRLEDTDQTRLVDGAEKDIYDTLRWAGLNWDEGPEVGGPYGPYRQSERSAIYRKYSNKLIESGHAYRCFCSKDRLEALRESAKKLHPPSMASYDRKCSHLSKEESEKRASNGESFTVRFKAPHSYPPFEDMLHGKLSLQTQINFADVRYEDPVLMKSDDLPTYHLANVVDDHLMEITHVIRGEEWLLSAPKHAAIYDALGWRPPKYAHIPLLTSISSKKLSKRSGETGISALAAKGILPEALVNFVALFGWSPNRGDAVGECISEIFTLDELVKQFALDGLTKGNTKVDDKKLMHFNNHFFKRRLESKDKFDEILNQCHALVKPFFIDNNSDIDLPLRQSKEYTAKLLDIAKERIGSVGDFLLLSKYFYTKPDWSGTDIHKTIARIDTQTARNILADALPVLEDPEYVSLLVAKGYKKKDIFQVLRFALLGGVSGVKIPTIIEVLGISVSKSRLLEAQKAIL